MNHHTGVDQARAGRADAKQCERKLTSDFDLRVVGSRGLEVALTFRSGHSLCIIIWMDFFRRDTCMCVCMCACVRVCLYVYFPANSAFA